MESNKFPDSVDEVLNQSGQFSTVANGAINTVKIDNFLIDNVVDTVINYNEDNNNDGALYFTTGTFNHTYLFTDEVHHNYYK